MDFSTDLIRFFARHFVAMRWFELPSKDAQPSQGKPHIASCFVVAIEGFWILITAGHVLADIESAQKAGQIFKRFHLDDGWAKPNPFDSIPFDFDGAVKGYVYNDDSGDDYGYIVLRQNTVSLLEANGIVPLTENFWEQLPDVYEAVFLIGIPAEFTKYEQTVTQTEITSSLVVFAVELTPTPPSVFIKPRERFYGRIAKLIIGEDERVLQSLDGMSGCPLIGLTLNEDYGEYWLLGVQSTQSESRDLAIAVPFKPFGEAVRKRIRELTSSTDTMPIRDS